MRVEYRNTLLIYIYHTLYHIFNSYSASIGNTQFSLSILFFFALRDAFREVTFGNCYCYQRHISFDNVYELIEEEFDTAYTSHKYV